MKSEFPKMEIDERGNKRWRNEKGEYHREDGPAVEYADGRKEWIQNNLLHREDGPAIVRVNGDKSWHLKGITYTEEEYWQKLAEMKRPKFPKMEVDGSGNKRWLNEKVLLHREDGPAVECKSGAKEWWVNGKRHRTDGPAVEHSDGCKEWWVKGLRHREDGPAVIDVDGYKEWWFNGAEYTEPDYLQLIEAQKPEFPKMEIDKEGNKRWKNEKGKLHREDGPAVEHADGYKEWCRNGKTHREDGPAVECADGEKFWYLNGIEYSEEEYHKKLAEMKKSEYPKMEVDKYGNKRWFNEKRQPHREDGPAIEHTDGTKDWYLNGKLHREDGPAVEFNNGDKCWFLDGTKYTKEDYHKKLAEMKKSEFPKVEIDKYGNRIWKNEKGELHREDGPAVEYADGDKYWYRNDKRHREDGPAVEYSTGAKEWCLNGLTHREDGPAIEHADGNKSWWLNGIRYSEEEYHQELAEMKKSEFPKMEIDKEGNKIWRNEKGQVHREDGPAGEFADGHKEWVKNNLPHREDGPAVEKANGEKFWFLDGIQYSEEDYHRRLSEMKKKSEFPKMEIDKSGNKRWLNQKGEYHREDGPAVERANGIKEWWFKGELHREDGPAIEYTDGSKHWYLNGRRHREDGPAVEYTSGDKFWFLDGIRYYEEDYYKKLAEMKKSQFPKMEINKNGNKRWLNEKGELHREDGPAIENRNGFKAWYLNGNLHREDGPAIEYSASVNNAKSWHLKGIKYTEEEYWQKLAEMKKSQFPKMPIVDRDGNKRWLDEKGRYHREDGPAVESTCGRKEWAQNGVLHRIDGPAVERPDGSKEWWLNGARYSVEEYWQALKRFKSRNAREAIMAQEDARILADLKGVSNVVSKEDKMSFSDKVKSDAVDASYRVARKQIMNIVRNGLLKAMEKNKIKKAQVKAFAEFLTTDLGEAMMLGLIGHGADFIPGLKDNPIVQKLAKEARVEGMAVAGNFVVESVASTVLPEVMGVLGTLTESEKKLRIGNAPEAKVELPEGEEEDEPKANVFAMKRG